MTRTEYQNAQLIKWYNSKVFVINKPKDGYIVKFKKLTDNLQPRAIHQVHKEKIVETIFKLSDEGALALYIALGEQLKKDNKI